MLTVDLKYEQMDGQSERQCERYGVMAKLVGEFLKLLIEDAPHSTKRPIVITFTKTNHENMYNNAYRITEVPSFRKKIPFYDTKNIDWAFCFTFWPHSITQK